MIDIDIMEKFQLKEYIRELKSLLKKCVKHIAIYCIGCSKGRKDCKGCEVEDLFKQNGIIVGGIKEGEKFQEHAEDCCSRVYCELLNFSKCPSYLECKGNETITAKCTCGKDDYN